MLGARARAAFQSWGSGTATGLNCNTTYHFRVSERGDGSTYSTTFGGASSSVSGATSACAPTTPTVGVDVDSPFTGQAVKLTAATPSGSDPVSSHQWQEWLNGAWSNLGAKSTSATRSVSSSVAGLRSFRVVVAYTSARSGESAPVAVEWRDMSVSVSASPEYPLSASSTRRTVTLTATTTAPSGVNYRWQQATSTSWTNLGAKTTSATKEVSSAERGTRKYRVVVGHATASSVVSEPVYVTWDEWAIVADMIGELSVAVATSTAYKAAQTALLGCMNGGGATSTTPTYTSFDDILSRYATTTKARMEGTCGTQATAMFSANQSVARAELAKLKTGTSTKAVLYAAWLDTPQGRLFEADLGDPDELKLVAYLGTTTFEPGEFTRPLYRGMMGQDGPDERELPVVGTGLDCLPKSVSNGADLTLANKLVVLNCLVFSTPHEFWVQGDKRNRDAEQLRRAIDSRYARFAWLDRGDWSCTKSPDGPLPSCLKHDVAYGGLQKFARPGCDSRFDLRPGWRRVGRDVEPAVTRRLPMPNSRLT